MESVIRALIMYAFLLVVFRIAGKRTLSEATHFELVLLLIISETTQEAMVDQDHSLTNAFVLVITLISASIGLSLAKRRWPVIAKWLDGLPFAIVRNGVPDRAVMDKVRVNDAEILAAARQQEGLKSMAEIEHAVVEENGQITVVPRKQGG